MHLASWSHLRMSTSESFGCFLIDVIRATCEVRTQHQCAAGLHCPACEKMASRTAGACQCTTITALIMSFFNPASNLRQANCWASAGCCQGRLHTLLDRH